jgi:hypothetical protein
MRILTMKFMISIFSTSARVFQTADRVVRAKYIIMTQLRLWSKTLSEVG